MILSNVKKGVGPIVTVEAIVDTGFSGFMQIPISTARELRLRRAGTVTAQLADGKVLPMPVAHISARLGNGEKVSGVAQVSPGRVMLVGMEFLQYYKAVLTVSHSNGVVIGQEA